MLTAEKLVILCNIVIALPKPNPGKIYALVARGLARGSEYASDEAERKELLSAAQTCLKVAKTVNQYSEEEQEHG